MDISAWAAIPPSPFEEVFDFIGVVFIIGRKQRLCAFVKNGDVVGYDILTMDYETLVKGVIYKGDVWALTTESDSPMCIYSYGGTSLAKTGYEREFWTIWKDNLRMEKI